MPKQRCNFDNYLKIREKQFLMSKWVYGISLNQINSDSIDYNASKQPLIHIIIGNPELFNRNKKVHVNNLIGDINRI